MFLICTLSAGEFIFLSLLIWIAGCTQFLSENRLNRCQIFGQFVFFLKTVSGPIVIFLLTPTNLVTWPILCWPQKIGDIDESQEAAVDTLAVLLEAVLVKFVASMLCVSSRLPRVITMHSESVLYCKSCLVVYALMLSSSVDVVFFASASCNVWYIVQF